MAWRPVSETKMSAVPVIPANPSVLQRMAQLDPKQRFRLMAGVALLVVIAIVGVVMGRQAEWRVLYTNLSDKDGGVIIAQLTQMNVPYKYTEGGAAILVPAERVHDTRLRLASQGLPKGSVAGFESMESNNRFGMTQFQERLAFQRGLEGELTRSIQSLSSVQSARVHLALPNQNGFFREQQKPSASVLVSLHPGRTLDRAQLAGIVHLVASSVPEMNPTAVSVLDDTGKLLSSQEGVNGAAGGADALQLQYVQQIEQTYSRRILEILEPVVGRSNVKATVTAEVDFSQVEQTSEQHKPNQTPESGAVRSQQLVESVNGSTSPGPTGVPGAVSNQPPGPTSAPINGPAQTLATAGGTVGAGGNSRRESIVNYEVDKTVKVVRGSTGVIKRLSAAVVLNHQTATDDKGKTVTTPLTEQQLEKMTALVRETIGFNQERGDSVNLMNAPFAKEKPTESDAPFWRDPEVADIARNLAWPVGALLFAALVLLGLVRPGLQALTKPPEVPQLDALLEEEPDRPKLPPPRGELTQGETMLEDARKLARENPAAVAAIVRNWMSNELAG
jgi:flagellar M-ring protein FliF